MVHTRGRGGQSVTKGFKVSTNDPKQGQVELVVTGKVDGFAQMDPPRLSLMGRVGDSLSQQVRITPNPKHPFKIKEAKANTNRDIRLELKPAGKDPAREGYLLTVSVVKTNAGSFSDYIQIHTDLKEQPAIGIPVQGRLMTPPVESDGKNPK